MPIGIGKANVATKATNVEVEEASTEIIAANENRNGLELVNTSTQPVYLGLGKAGEAKKGILLTANGGSWDGLIGPMLWTGSVFGAAGGAKSIVTVLEV